MIAFLCRIVPVGALLRPLSLAPPPAAFAADEERCVDDLESEYANDAEA